jgi:hypothetical protein
VVSPPRQDNVRELNTNAVEIFFGLRRNNERDFACRISAQAMGNEETYRRLSRTLG